VSSIAKSSTSIADSERSEGSSVRIGIGVVCGRDGLEGLLEAGVGVEGGEGAGVRDGEGVAEVEMMEEEEEADEESEEGPKPSISIR
jgi:hypothetical protein